MKPIDRLKQEQCYWCKINEDSEYECEEMYGRGIELGSFAEPCSLADYANCPFK